MEKVVQALAEMYGDLHWHWHPGTPRFEIAVGAILVQNTAWANVERAMDRLRAAGALEPRAMAALSDAELEHLIRPSGQFRQKARKLRAFLATVTAAGGLEALLALPPAELRRRLRATWGIGPETADCILCYAAGYPAMVVDAYTIRVLRRLGLGPARDTYDAWQRWLEGELATLVSGSQRPTLYARLHAHFVLHAKHRCRKHSPRCDQCLLANACAVPRSRAKADPGASAGAVEATVAKGAEATG